MQKLLLTGFEGFGGRTDNPSAEVANALGGYKLDNAIVVSSVLPVTNHDLRSNLVSLIDEVEPFAVVCLGLAPGASVIRIERLAANYSRFDIKDNAGEQYCGSVVKDGPAAYEATLPLEDMLNAVNRCGIPAQLSHSAGAYLCNAVMYHALDYCSLSNLHYRSGFIHLPYMPSQVCDMLSSKNCGNSTDRLSSMSLDDQKQAVVEMLKCITSS